MKLPKAGCLLARAISLLGTLSYLASIAALSIPPDYSIALRNSSQFYPLISNTSQAYPVLSPLLNASNDKYIHCTLDSNWSNEPPAVFWRYDHTCRAAAFMFLKEVKRYSATAFEFLAPGATAITKLPTMQTPRRYTVGGFNVNCTDADRSANGAQEARDSTLTRRAHSPLPCLILRPRTNCLNNLKRGSYLTTCLPLRTWKESQPKSSTVAYGNPVAFCPIFTLAGRRLVSPLRS